MTSINFNAAANSALRTLQSTNSALDATQNRISTGLKISEAKDNAAYWSISTTLKSDNKALGTVKDALSLGAATVDTAYEGLNSALSVLNELKSKITAASQDGVDKASVQSEIVELQKQLKAIANSSTFSGENWLSVNSSVSGYNAAKTVVSAFSRDASNNVTLDTINIDTSTLVLIDGSATNEGILDAGKSGNGTLTGGIMALSATGTPATGASTGTKSTLGAGTFDNTKLADTETVTFDLAVGSTSDSLSISVDAAMAADTDGSDFAGAIQDAIDASGLTGLVTVNIDATTKAITFTAVDNGTDAIAVSNIANADTAANIGGLIDNGTSTAGTADVAASAGTAAVLTSTTAFAAFTLDANDSIKFDLTVNGVAKTVRVDKSVVDQALGTTDGVVGSTDDYADVLTLALQKAGISGVTVSDDAGNANMVFTGNGSVTSLASTAGVASDGDSILEIDVTTASKATLQAYLENVSTAADKITSGAATLGAVSARIDLQKTFVQNLMDTIDKGVSGLIDADMNEESTKLQALQVKQQLGVQALSIANQSAQNVLSLFRS